MNNKIRRNKKGQFVPEIRPNGNDVGLGSDADVATAELPPVKEPASAQVSENTAVTAEPK